MVLQMTAKSYGYKSVEHFKYFLSKLKSKRTTVYLANGEKTTVSEALTMA